jgi:hypothetical protein
MGHCYGCHRPISSQETLYIKGGNAYCCAACARNVGCTCPRHDRSTLELVTSAAESGPPASNATRGRPSHLGRS